MCGQINFAMPAGLDPSIGYSVQSQLWEFGDPQSGVTNTSTQSNPSHFFLANGTYTVKLILNYFPCGTDTLRQVIQIAGLPAISVTGKNKLCTGEQLLLTVNGVSSYSLNGQTTTQPTTTLQPLNNNTYTISSYDPGTGCTALVTHPVEVLSCTLLQNGTPESSLFLFPNPCDEYIKISSTSPCAVGVYDFSGNLLTTIQVSPGTCQINTSGFANGIYFLKFTGKAGVSAYKKIVKE
jgi:PKD repeat protein